MSYSHWSGPLHQGTDVRPSASTNVLTSRLVVAAAASFEGAVSMSGGAVSILSGAGNVIKVSAGTYIGSGAATAPIKASGLTTCRHVWMVKRTASRASAATSNGRITPTPTLASGTVGSFYPLICRTAATNKEINLGTGSAGTYSWFAVGS